MAFLFGLLWGSFFNVCIYRLPINKSVVRPGSHCYSCGTFLKWHENIPVLGYIMQRGACRTCGASFSARYAGIELLSGLLFLAAFARFGFQLQTLTHLVFISLLVVGTFTDIDHFILPNGVTWGGAAFAVAVAAILGPYAFIAEQYVLAHSIYRSFSFRTAPVDLESLPHFIPLLWSLISAAIGYGMLWAIALLGRLLFRKEAMGGGDVKLFAFLGAYMGAINCLWILFLSAVLGATVGLSLIGAHWLVGKDEFDTVELDPAQQPKLDWLNAVSQLNKSAAATEPEALPAPGDDLSATRAAEDKELVEAPKMITLQIAQRTTRQMHHFPYGPYIAVAALIVLFVHDKINAATRVALLLP